MFPESITYRFTIADEPYCLVEYDAEGEDRIRAYYSRAIAAAPDIMDALYKEDLWAKAVARVCLKEAPAIFWKDLPAPAQQNGKAEKVIGFEGVHRLQWAALRIEIDAFLVRLQQPVSPAPAPAPGTRESDADAVAPLEAVPALLGRAI